MIEYGWRGPFESSEVETLHAQCFGHAASDWDWFRQVDSHSLGWACARARGALVGWVNVAWDGAGHAFVLDAIVATSHRRQGIARRLVAIATEAARDVGCEWLHVDFDDDLRSFYFDACDFTPTNAGLIRL
ncbi:MAG: GNAT family N-acetyltransferase [Actinomycetes bacterium]